MRNHRSKLFVIFASFYWIAAADEQIAWHGPTTHSFRSRIKRRLIAILIFSFRSFFVVVLFCFASSIFNPKSVTKWRVSANDFWLSISTQKNDALNGIENARLKRNAAHCVQHSSLRSHQKPIKTVIKLWPTSNMHEKEKLC